MNMDGVSAQTEARRRFLRMLVASPLFSGSLFGGSLRNLLPILEVLQQTAEVISSPDQALDVMDFEPAARKASRPESMRMAQCAPIMKGIRASRFGPGGLSTSRKSTCLSDASGPPGAVPS